MRRTLIRARRRLRRELDERPFAPPSRERVSGLIESVATEAELGAGNYTLLQPAERVVRRPPRTVHEELHPVFHALREHHQPEVFKAVLRGGRVVAPDPLIVTRDFRVLVRSHYHPSEIRKSRVMTHRLPRPTRMAGAAIALVTPWYQNHYHWLVDHLGRAPLLDDEPDLPVVVPPRPSRAQLESLDLVGIDRGAAASTPTAPRTGRRAALAFTAGRDGSPPSAGPCSDCASGWSQARRPLEAAGCTSRAGRPTSAAS